jgi:putative membrane protein
MNLNFDLLFNAALASIVFSIIGIVFFGLAFLIIQWVTPFSIRKEIEEDQNTALAIVIGAVILGVAMIVSAAVHG